MRRETNAEPHQIIAICRCRVDFDLLAWVHSTCCKVFESGQRRLVARDVRFQQVDGRLQPICRGHVPVTGCARVWIDGEGATVARKPTAPSKVRDESRE